MSRVALLHLWRTSTAVVERGAGSACPWNGDGVVHANEHPGLRGNVEVLAFSRDDVNGAAGQTEAEATCDVAEDRANEGTATELVRDFCERVSSESRRLSPRRVPDS